mmetsp:Transcript_102700/g.314155  ORF Transcript_102700/g.314155 Transcript_102700/m.314155 type:complete len:221 (+) Transcript_102700:350-1012(+)
MHSVTTTTPAIMTSSMDNFRRVRAIRVNSRARGRSPHRRQYVAAPNAAISAMVKVATNTRIIMNAMKQSASPRSDHDPSMPTASDKLTSAIANSGMCSWSMTGWVSKPIILAGIGPFGEYMSSKSTRSAITGMTKPLTKLRKKPAAMAATSCDARARPSHRATGVQHGELLPSSLEWMPREATVEQTQKRLKQTKPTSSSIIACNMRGWFRPRTRYSSRI